MSEDIREIIERVERRVAIGSYYDGLTVVLAAFARDAISRIEKLEAENKRLRRAASQALTTMEWAEANVPGTNLRSDIILLRDALALEYLPAPRRAALIEENTE